MADGVEIDGKICPGCREWKPRASFYPSKYTPYGMRARCIDCEKKGRETVEYRRDMTRRMREWRAAHPRPRAVRPSVEIQLSPVEWAWLAGLMDGEGCISITRVPPSIANHHKQAVYRLHLILCMCDEATVRRVHEMVGIGTVRVYNPKNPKHSTQFQWSVGNQLAACFLQGIAPYSFTKAPEVECAQKFLEIPLWRAAHDPSVQLAREQAYDYMKTCKRQQKAGSRS